MDNETFDEKFDEAYAKAGSSTLATLNRIKGMIIDYPADSSCGAKWADFGTLSFVRDQLLELEKIMMDLDA